MAKKKSVKKPSAKTAHKSKSAKKTSSRSVTKVKTSSQFKLISIYILLGIIFLGYIFYHSSQNKQEPPANDYPVTETSE